MRRFLSILLAAMLLATAMLGCGAAFAEEDEENYETGDASLDDPRNADGIS